MVDTMTNTVAAPVAQPADVLRRIQDTNAALVQIIAEAKQKLAEQSTPDTATREETPTEHPFLPGSTLASQIPRKAAVADEGARKPGQGWDPSSRLARSPNVSNTPAATAPAKPWDAGVDEEARAGYGRLQAEDTQMRADKTGGMLVPEFSTYRDKLRSQRLTEKVAGIDEGRRQEKENLALSLARTQVEKAQTDVEKEKAEVARQKKLDETGIAAQPGHEWVRDANGKWAQQVIKLSPAEEFQKERALAALKNAIPGSTEEAQANATLMGLQKALDARTAAGAAKGGGGQSGAVGTPLSLINGVWTNRPVANSQVREESGAVRNKTADEALAETDSAVSRLRPGDPKIGQLYKALIAAFPELEIKLAGRDARPPGPGVRRYPINRGGVAPTASAQPTGTSLVTLQPRSAGATDVAEMGVQGKEQLASALRRIGAKSPEVQAQIDALRQQGRNEEADALERSIMVLPAREAGPIYSR